MDFNNTENNTNDYADLTDEDIREKLIWRWFNFFRQNKDFKSYCEAKRGGKEMICTDLERKFQKIAELYKDWNDIHILPAMHEGSEDWKKWFADNQQMFFPAPVELCKTPIYDKKSGITLVSIPIGYSKKQLQKSFEQFIERHPDILGTGVKYPIREIRGETQRKTLLRMDRADLVHDLMSGYDDFKFTYRRIATLAIEELGYDYSVREFLFPRSEMPRSTSKNNSNPEPDVENFKRTIITFKKFYDECIKSTISGVFPPTMS